MIKCALQSNGETNMDSLQYIYVIDQACSVKDGWILAKFFFCVFMDRDEVEVHKNAKKKNEANIQPS